MRSLVIALTAFSVALLWSPAAAAEVTSTSPGGFVLTAEADVAASPDAAWRALTRLNRWWNSSHTYSGDARRLSLEPRAGGCWCETWNGNSVEHARVLTVHNLEGVRTLRLQGALGPLQEVGANGVLTFTIAPHASGAKITMTYRVSGDAALNLPQLAPLVDQVLMEQFGRLSRYTASGSPD